jgi:hypothetical protein
MKPDPTMPRVMPPAIERSLREVLGWRDRPNPIDLYMAIKDELERVEEGRDGRKSKYPFTLAFVCAVVDSYFALACESLVLA